MRHDLSVRWGAALALAMVLVGSAHGGTRVLLRSGDATADGERLATFVRPVPSSGGAVAFTGGSGALLLKEGATFVVVARTGDALPAPLAGTFNAFGGTAINDAGGVAFRATLNSTAADEGLFLYRGGVLETVALGGGAAGPDGVGYPELNDAFDVAWGNRGGLRLWSAATGTVARLADRGGSTPSGGTFQRFGRTLGLNDAGAVAFAAAHEALYVYSGGEVRAGLRGGEVAAGAGTIVAFDALAFDGQRLARIVSLDDGPAPCSPGSPGRSRRSP